MIAPFYFSPFQDEVLLTNDAGCFIFLSKDNFHKLIKNEENIDPTVLENLIEDGFCFTDSIESYIRRNKDAVKDANGYLLNGTSLIILAVTNACNNRCVYCQANGKCESKIMSTEVAEMALQRIKEMPAAEITIEFQGGEPLLNFPVIRYVVERGEEVLHNKSVRYTVVSNLGLLTEEIASFFAVHNVSVSTSLDGPSAVHNMNRPKSSGYGSYQETVNGIAFLRTHGIMPGAIQTTTSNSLSYAEQIVDEYVEHGFHQIFLRPLTRLGAAARRWDQIGYDSQEFLAFYRKALNRILEYNKRGYNLVEYHAALFLTKILYGRSVNYMELRSPCGAGIGQIAITANGTVYTCDEGRMMAEMGDEAFQIGNVFDSSYYEWLDSSCCQAVCSASLLDLLPGCCDCVFKPYCGTCPVINYAIYGNITHVSSERCKIYKGILTVLFEYIKVGNDEIMRIFEEWGKQA